MLFFFPAKQKLLLPEAQYYPVPNNPLLHIPHVAANYFCTSQVSHPWIYPLVTPTLSSSVCKIGLARAAISRRMGSANLGHRMSHKSNIFQYRQDFFLLQIQKELDTSRL